MQGETEAPPRRWHLVRTLREGAKPTGGNRARRRASGIMTKSSEVGNVEGFREQLMLGRPAAQTQ